MQLSEALIDSVLDGYRPDELLDKVINDVIEGVPEGMKDGAIVISKQQNDIHFKYYDEKSKINLPLARLAKGQLVSAGKFSKSDQDQLKAVKAFDPESKYGYFFPRNYKKEFGPITFNSIKKKGPKFVQKLLNVVSDYKTVGRQVWIDPGAFKSPEKIG